MNAFRVWVKRLDYTSSLRVDDAENAKWLLHKMSEFFVFKTCEPMEDIRNSAGCTFRVSHTSQMSGAGLERLLARIPEVQLMLERA
jgi:hypothetical protein